MDLLYIVVILFTLYGEGSLQLYQAREATDSSVKKEVIQKRGDSQSITFTCTFDIPEVAKKFLVGDVEIKWFKTQNETALRLNDAGKLDAELPTEMKQHLDYTQDLPDDNSLKTSLTIKDARPEESGQYRCEALSKDGQTSQLTYNLVITDPSEFQVILHGSDNPHMIPRKPNVTTWQNKNEIQLKEMQHDMQRPEQYAYLACVAGAPSINAVITVTLENTDYPERSRNLHSRMTSVQIVDNVGTVPEAQKLMFWNLVEDRSFPVDSRDDGAKIICTGTVEDSNNEVIMRKEVSSVLNLLAKPQFVNCSKEVYSPMGAQNFVISCAIRAKPMLTGEILWSVQPRDSQEFQIQDNIYGYRTEVNAEGNNLFMAKLIIEQVSEQEHLRAVFKITARNSIGINEFRILLLEGEDPTSKQTTGASSQLASVLLLLLSAVAAILVQ